MPKPLIAGNWKMNMDTVSGYELMDDMLDDLDAIEAVDVAICPPFVLLESFAELFDGTGLYLGAQNMHWEEKGAFTGEVSPTMLKNVGCDYVILGHSERRQLFGETDEIVRRKVEAALKHDLRPIICVGERLEENQAGKTLEVVTRQVRSALDGLQPELGPDTVKLGDIVIAYEPIWAIGTGLPATGEGANEVIGAIRGIVGELHGGEVASGVRILYGGSANAKNIEEFVSQPEIDGALVGGASLDAEGFVRMVALTNEVKGKARP
jgi:triosephosphate isomerase (TIM)